VGVNGFFSHKTQNTPKSTKTAILSASGLWRTIQPPAMPEQVIGSVGLLSKPSKNKK
jgi:hypothetical protein